MYLIEIIYDRPTQISFFFKAGGWQHSSDKLTRNKIKLVFVKYI